MKAVSKGSGDVYTMKFEMETEEDLKKRESTTFHENNILTYIADLSNDETNVNVDMFQFFCDSLVVPVEVYNMNHVACIAFTSNKMGIFEIAMRYLRCKNENNLAKAYKHVMNYALGLGYDNTEVAKIQAKYWARTDDPNWFVNTISYDTASALRSVEFMVHPLPANEETFVADLLYAIQDHDDVKEIRDLLKKWMNKLGTKPTNESWLIVKSRLQLVLQPNGYIYPHGTRLARVMIADADAEDKIFTEEQHNEIQPLLDALKPLEMRTCLRCGGKGKG
jgi:hypothetical protein